MKNLSEEALEAIVGAIPAGVVVIEKSNSKIIYANERAIDLYGVDLCGLEMAQHSTKIMRTLTLKGDVYPPEQFPVSKALLRGKEAKDELIIERPDGSCIIVSASAKPIKDKNGQVVAAVGFFEDITERKNAEKTLKRKQQELTLILDSDPTIIFYKDRQGKVIQANKAFGEALKVPKEVLLGKTVFDIYSPIIAQAMTNDDAEVLKSGQPKLGIIEPYEAPTGLRWIRTDKVPTFDEDGIVNGLVGFSEDVTEQMQAELELKERYTLLESISQNIDAGLAIIDKDYRVIWANDILRRIGACTDGLCYKNIAHAETVCLDCGVKKIFNENVPLDVHEYRTVNQKGETVWIELRVTPLKDACGNVKSALELAVPITERKKAEEAVRIEKERFESLANSLPEIVFETDIDGNLLFANEHGYEITGYSKEDFNKGFDVFNLIAPQDKEKVIEDFKKTLNNQPTPYNEFTIMRKDGSTFPAIIITNTIVKEGHPTGLRGLVIDITERKKAEETLRLSEERFEQMIEQSPVVFEVYDMQGFQTKVNPAYEKFWNIPKELTLGKYNILKSEQVIKNNLLQYVERAYAGEIANVPDYQYDASLEPSTCGLGRKRWLNAILYPLRDEHGKVTGIAVLHEDITERKNAEEALRDSEVKFQSIIEESPAIFGVYDKNGFLIQVNRPWDNLWQVPREYVIGKWNILQSKQVKEIGWLPLLKSAYAGETVNVPEKEFDASLEPEALGKGRKRWLKSVIYPIKRTNGEVTNIVMMHEDISEKKALEKQLKDSERFAAIGQTAGMVGHDIRNPLQAVLSDTYLLKDELASMPECANKEGVWESIDSIERNVAYINKIVQDLQDYARKVAPEYSITDLSDVFVHVFEIISIPESINFSINVKDAEKIRVDPALLQRAITNLVNNAIQAMPNGGKLEIRGAKIDTRIVVTVSDTGMGIPDDVKPKLFTPMMTTKAKGQGFGLAASKRMIEAMNGTISFESEKGKGTKFTIELPTA